jgi:nucleoside triphosphate pyrophosphatase
VPILKPLVLASGSPRRREILTTAGIPFTVKAANIPEEVLPGETPRDYVLRLASAKAKAVDDGAGDVILAADTVVVLDESILEKPSDAADAERMLRQLAGREHVVMTGVCLRYPGGQRTAVECTRVRFTELTDDEIAEYVRSGEPMDKAGAYAIQGLASKFVDRVEGCYFNVVGLPIARIYGWLKVRPTAGR